MRQDRKLARQHQIEDAAYAVLETKGYEGTSMAGIAKMARASNETLYNWYGDKKGLFQTLVTRNASEVKLLLEQELMSNSDALAILRKLGPKLLMLLTGERAVALNRAAAADRSGELGKTLSISGREAVFPLLRAVLERAQTDGQLGFADTADAVELYLNLLIGDLQIRRVIGRAPPPTPEFCEQRAANAVLHLSVLLAPDRPPHAPDPPDVRR